MLYAECSYLQIGALGKGWNVDNRRRVAVIGKTYVLLECVTIYSTLRQIKNEVLT